MRAGWPGIKFVPCVGWLLSVTKVTLSWWLCGGDAGEGDEGREERAAVRAMRGAFRVQALRCMEAVAR